mgnify:CR=1 FL=1
MYSYKTKGVCSREIQFDVENDIIKEVRFIGGCMGNTQGVAALAKGRNIDEVINTIKGIDQLALALIAYKEQQA